MASRYDQIIDGEWTDWSKKAHLGCCDCLLVHKMELRRRNGQLQVRMTRDNRATAARRRNVKTIRVLKT